MRPQWGVGGQIRSPRSISGDVLERKGLKYSGQRRERSIKETLKVDKKVTDR